MVTPPLASPSQRPWAKSVWGKGSHVRQLICATESRAGKLLSPSRRRRCIDHVRQTLGVSERRACRTLGQHRSTQRKEPCGLPDEARLRVAPIEMKALKLWSVLQERIAMPLFSLSLPK